MSFTGQRTWIKYLWNFVRRTIFISTRNLSQMVIFLTCFAPLCCSVKVRMAHSNNLYKWLFQLSWKSPHKLHILTPVGKWTSRPRDRKKSSSWELNPRIFPNIAADTKCCVAHHSLILPTSIKRWQLKQIGIKEHLLSYFFGAYFASLFIQLVFLPWSELKMIDSKLIMLKCSWSIWTITNCQIQRFPLSECA